MNPNFGRLILGRSTHTILVYAILFKGVFKKPITEKTKQTFMFFKNASFT